MNKLRTVSIILFVLAFTWTNVAYSQQTEDGKDRMISLPLRNLRLDSLSNLLSRETGFVLSFNAGRINPGTEIILPGTNLKIDTLLLYLRRHYRLTYKIIGNHIILYNEAPATKKIQLSDKTRTERVSGASPAISHHPQTDSVLLEKEIKPQDPTNPSHVKTGASLEKPSLRVPNYAAKLPVGQNDLQQVNTIEAISRLQRKLVIQIQIPDTSDAIGNRSGVEGVSTGRSDNRFYALLGFTTSDVLYLNPQIKIGLPWLFGIASWETNFKASGFFYGLGTSMRLSDKWNIQLSATNGTLRKDFGNLTFTDDTIGRAKTNLTRLDFLAGKHLAKRWTLQFGPTVNFMRGKYFLTGSSLVNFFPPVGMNESMNILNPLYTLNNSYDEKTGVGKKMWVGLKVGLFYTL